MSVSTGKGVKQEYKIGRDVPPSLATANRHLFAQPSPYSSALSTQDLPALTCTSTTGSMRLVSASGPYGMQAMLPITGRLKAVGLSNRASRQLASSRP